VFGPLTFSPKYFGPFYFGPFEQLKVDQNHVFEQFIHHVIPKSSTTRLWSFFYRSHGPKSYIRRDSKWTKITASMHAYAFRWLPPSHSFLDQKVDHRVWKDIILMAKVVRFVAIFKCHRFCRRYLRITDLDHFGDRSGGSCRDNTFIIIKRNGIYTFLDHLWFWTRRCFLHWWICYACAQVSRLKLRYWWHQCWHRGYWWHK